MSVGRRWLVIGIFLPLLVVAVDWLLSPADYEAYEIREYAKKPQSYPKDRALFTGPFFATTGWLVTKQGNALTAIATIGLLLVTGSLAFYTLNLWRETGKLVSASEDTARRELRACVGIETVDHDGRSLKIRIRNFGQTTAHHVTMIWTASFSDREASYRHPGRKDGEPLANQMLLPGQAFNYDITLTSAEETIQLGVGQSLPFYLYGRIDYMDIYKRWWITYFCQHYIPGLPEGARSRPHTYHNYEYPTPESV